MSLNKLVARNISKSYGGKPVINGISIELVTGDVLAVTGPSGSGKTTLLRILGGLLIPTKGEVRYNGTNIYLSKNYRVKYIRKVGFSFQEPTLIPFLTVIQNIIAPLIPLTKSSELNEKIKTAYELLNKLRLIDKASKYPNKLSTGERKRVDLIRALIKDPEVLILDEPLTNLDKELIEDVEELIRDLMRERITLISTHLRTELIKNANKNIVMTNTAERHKNN